MRSITLVSVSFGIALGVPVLGCDDVEFPKPHRIDSLRVLGVSAEPATLTPGESTKLTLSCADGIRGGAEDPACNVEVAWFAGCNNPENNDPKKCFSQYGSWFETLGQPIAEIHAESYHAGFGFGPSFGMQAPADILAQSFEAAGTRVGYGTSFVYFAVCAGRLVTAPGSDTQLPVACRDRDSGQPLDQSRWVVGVTTIYSYDLIRSLNPKVLGVNFGWQVIPTSCASSTECPVEFECSADSACVPIVRPCTGASAADCEPHTIGLGLGIESYSLFTLDGTMLPSPHKSLWLDYYTNAGSVPEDARINLGRFEYGGTRVGACCATWRAPSTPTEHAHVWLVVRDNRGGLTVHDQRIIVR